MAQVSPEAMIELMQTVNKTQSVQIDEQTKTIKELRELVAELRGTIIDGQKQIVRPGDVLRMPAGCKHTIVADTELQVIEVQMGKDISVHDKEKFELAL